MRQRTKGTYGSGSELQAGASTSNDTRQFTKYLALWYFGEVARQVRPALAISCTFILPLLPFEVPARDPQQRVTFLLNHSGGFNTGCKALPLLPRRILLLASVFVLFCCTTTVLGATAAYQDTSSERQECSCFCFYKA